MTDPVVMFYPAMSREAKQNAQRVLDSRWIGEGKWVEDFEAAIAKLCQVEHVCATNSGTSALRLALAVLGVGPGDEVVSTAQSCTATNMPILEQGAVPVFADIQYDTGNIDPADIAHRITDRTRAIMCVHWGGLPCDMDEIHQVAGRHNLPVIEDAAHAFGAVYKGRPIGGLSDATAFSFQAIKLITCVDGGALILPDPVLHEAAMRRRWFAIDRKRRTQRIDGYSYWPQEEVGYKYHMNNLCAAIGLGNMEHFEQWLSARREMVTHYRYALRNVPGLTLFRDRPETHQSAHWLFTVHVERREDFCRMMRSRDIEASVVHVRNDSHPIFGPRREDLPETDRYEQTAISLPMHNRLGIVDLCRVCDAIKGGW